MFKFPTPGAQMGVGGGDNIETLNLLAHNVICPLRWTS